MVKQLLIIILTILKFNCYGFNDTLVYLISDFDLGDTIDISFYHERGSYKKNERLKVIHEENFFRVIYLERDTSVIIYSFIKEIPWYHRKKANLFLSDLKKYKNGKINEKYFLSKNKRFLDKKWIKIEYGFKQKEVLLPNNNYNKLIFNPIATGVRFRQQFLIWNFTTLKELNMNSHGCKPMVTIKA